MAIKGRRQYEAFQAGKPLSFKGAILAQCYVCNGEDEGGVDCLGISCPLYQYFPYRRNKVKKQMNPERRAKLEAALKRGRETIEKHRIEASGAILDTGDAGWR
jgi:hypothetical protein